MVVIVVLGLRHSEIRSGFAPPFEANPWSHQDVCRRCMIFETLVSARRQKKIAKTSASPSLSARSHAHQSVLDLRNGQQLRTTKSPFGCSVATTISEADFGQVRRCTRSMAAFKPRRFRTPPTQKSAHAPFKAPFCKHSTGCVQDAPPVSRSRTLPSHGRFGCRAR